MEAATFDFGTYNVASSNRMRQSSAYCIGTTLTKAPSAVTLASPAANTRSAGTPLLTSQILIAVALAPAS